MEYHTTRSRCKVITLALRRDTTALAGRAPVTPSTVDVESEAVASWLSLRAKGVDADTTLGNSQDKWQRVVTYSGQHSHAGAAINSAVCVAVGQDQGNNGEQIFFARVASALWKFGTGAKCLLFSTSANGTQLVFCGTELLSDEPHCWSCSTGLPAPTQKSSSGCTRHWIRNEASLR